MTTEEWKKDGIIRLPDVLQLIGLKKSTLYELIKHGQFPAQRKLGFRSVGWKYAEVLSWIESRGGV